jgi:hypothetical protein
MREYMPTTHADPETIRAYAAGDASFDDIAEDRGPKIMTTMDLPFGQINDRGQQVKTRKLTASEKARKAKLEEDSRIYEAQLNAMQNGSVNEDEWQAGSAKPRRKRTVADGWAV